MTRDVLRTLVPLMALFAADATSLWPQGRSQSNHPLPVLLLTLGPHGFEPQEVSISSGKYILVIRNDTGIPLPSFQITPEVGRPLNDIPAKSALSRVSEVVTFVPGLWT